MSEASELTIESPETVAKPHRKPGPKLSANERAAIGALILAGHPKNRIAKQFDVSTLTVGQIAKTLQGPAIKLMPNWHQTQTALAVHSVNRALLDESDTYKSANIATQALKGLGVYSPDVVNQAAVIVQNLPNEVKELCNKYGSDAALEVAVAREDGSGPTTDSGLLSNNGAPDAKSNGINET